MHVSEERSQAGGRIDMEALAAINGRLRSSRVLVREKKQFTNWYDPNVETIEVVETKKRHCVVETSLAAERLRYTLHRKGAWRIRGRERLVPGGVFEAIQL